MKIDHILWEEVEIKYSEPVGHEERWEDRFTRCTVYFEGNEKILRINGVLLVNAEVVTITPSGMTFNATWWSAKFGAKTYDQKVRCKVECKF